MTTYIEYGVILTPNQKSKLVSAIKKYIDLARAKSEAPINKFII